GRIDVIIPRGGKRGRQRVLARVLTAEGQTIVGAPVEWSVEPASLGRIFAEGDTTWLEGVREGQGTLHVRSGQLEKISLIDVWEDHPELSLRVPDYRIKG